MRSLFILILLFSHALLGHAMDSSQTIWSFLGGGGRSHKGWGNTQLEVRTFDLVLRLERSIYKEKGAGLFRNQHNLMIEAPVHFLRDMDQPPMFGIIFNACWIFNFFSCVCPYFFFGGGPVYTQAEIPGTSSVIRGSYGFGSGIRLNMGPIQFILEVRYHHLSNGGIEKPNNPLNSHKFLIGLTLFPYSDVK